MNSVTDDFNNGSVIEIYNGFREHLAGPGSLYGSAGLVYNETISGNSVLMEERLFQVLASALLPSISAHLQAR
jgi:hypothetical protein